VTGASQLGRNRHASEAGISKGLDVRPRVLLGFVDRSGSGADHVDGE